MALEFGTNEWAAAWKENLNNSVAYREAAERWEGDLCFLLLPGEGIDDQVGVYADMWHGECRDACAVLDPAEKDPAFTLRGPLSSWQEILEGRLDPIKAIVSKKVKLKGNMVRIIQFPEAALELVACATAIDTVWPNGLELNRDE